MTKMEPSIYPIRFPTELSMISRLFLSLLFCVLFANTGIAQGLYGYDGGNNDLYSITSTPSSNFVGEDFNSGVVAEIEIVFGLMPSR